MTLGSDMVINQERLQARLQNMRKLIAASEKGSELRDDEKVYVQLRDVSLEAFQHYCIKQAGMKLTNAEIQQYHHLTSLDEDEFFEEYKAAMEGVTKSQAKSLWRNPYVAIRTPGEGRFIFLMHAIMRFYRKMRANQRDMENMARKRRISIDKYLES